VLGLALSLASIGVGYQLGTLTTRDTPISESTPSVQKQETEIPPQVEEEEEEADDQAISDGDLKAVPLGWMEPCKLVLVVRTDLKLSPGSIAAQCCQATLACYKALNKKNSYVCTHHSNVYYDLKPCFIPQAKIALKAKSEDELLELEAIAKSLNLCARSVTDPEKGGNVRSVLAIGPGPVGIINEVTGKLRLL
ncbi:hypothetical protein CVT25_014952, partial [Psilocybe cyanescens]